MRLGHATSGNVSKPGREFHRLRSACLVKPIAVGPGHPSKDGGDCLSIALRLPGGSIGEATVAARHGGGESARPDSSRSRAVLGRHGEKR
jgi:hypothetical protein